ncbi:MAG: glycerol-3-phosphate responsive antiterminator [Eubacterium sp.]|nr:glycerol-3-phosphate responsive antiterminator [Eubacterium sp.]
MSEEFRIIPSIRDVRYLKKAITECRDSQILLSNSHIGNLKQLSEICHKNGKQVIVNHELVGGLSNDKMAFQMLKNLYKVDAVIGSSISKMNMIRNLKFETIFRVSLMDSVSVEKALQSMKDVRFDIIELRPYYHALEFLPKFRQVYDGTYYVTGFVNTEEKLRISKEAGFAGAMTSNHELWGLQI